MVAMNVWPTDAGDGSIANEARWRKMARYWAPTGVLPGVGGELEPTLVYPTLTVKSGAVWIDGHFGELLTDTTLTATPTGLAVVRFDPVANTCELLWRDGATTPNQDPTGVWETTIFRYVQAGSIAMDMRRFAEPVVPYQSILENIINTVIPVNTTKNDMLAGSFVMPINGDAVFNGTLKLANATNNLCVADAVCISPASSTAPAQAPPSTWRTESAPGAGQNISHIPLIARWDNLKKGTVVQVRVSATITGIADCHIARVFGVVTFSARNLAGNW